MVTKKVTDGYLGYLVDLIWLSGWGLVNWYHIAQKFSKYGVRKPNSSFAA